MLVKDWMSKNVITADVNDSMQEAMNRLKKNDISMLPVMKKGNLVGIVTDRDLKRASASDANTLEVHELLFLITKIKVQDIMTENPVSIPFDFTVEEAAEVLLEKKISGAPVVDGDGKIIGVITKNDLFRVLIALTGVGKRGIQFAFEVEDRPGSIRELADVIRRYGGRMVSILSTYENVRAGYRKVFIRVYGVERDQLAQLEKELGGKAQYRYLVDHRENRREIF
ncbi:MAG: CBS and ACT domain-containing protein [Deltaproteobacteria bacterium]|nr:CBS and ACT domain-containing protein [Deltaproteobacteria bacterium]